jgi:outer membrane protein insertion porin family
VGDIHIHIAGEYPHTRENVIRNRISLKHGDILDIRQLRDSERRLKASQLFLNEPQRGIEPKLVIRPPEAKSLEKLLADEGIQQRTTYFRPAADEGRVAAAEMHPAGPRYMDVYFYTPRLNPASAAAPADRPPSLPQ